MPSIRAIETAAERVAPATQELAAGVSSELGGLFGRSFLREGEPAGPVLSRRFLRDDAGATVLNAVPADADWQARKSELAEVISRRIMEPRLTEEQFFLPVREFPEPDRPIVRQILEHSAGSSTEAGLMQSFHSVASQFRQRFEDMPPFLIAASAESPGNMLAYLFRKSGLGGYTFHLDSSQRLAGAYRTQPFLVFDDLKELKGAHRAVLTELQARNPIVAVDVNGFERAVNFIDFAHGQPTVVAKLDRLLKETKDLLGKETSLEPEQAIKRAIYGGFDQSVAAMNELKGARAKPIVTLRSELVAPSVAFQPLVTQHQIESFLEDRFPDSSEVRIAAAELLAEDVEFYSLQSLIPKLKDLQEALRQSAQRLSLDPDKDIFVVATEGDHSSSDAFMTYLYKQATGMADDRIVTLKQLESLSNEGLLENRRVVALDDAIYNGCQAKDLLDLRLAPYHHVAVATLSSFNKFARKMHEAYPGPRELRELVSLQTDFGLGVALNGAVNPLYARIRAPVRGELGVSDPVFAVASLKIFPHMASDTTPPWLRTFASKFPVTFGHAMSPEWLSAARAKP